MPTEAAPGCAIPAGLAATRLRSGERQFALQIVQARARGAEQGVTPIGESLGVTSLK